MKNEENTYFVKNFTISYDKRVTKSARQKGTL